MAKGNTVGQNLEKFGYITCTFNSSDVGIMKINPELATGQGNQIIREKLGLPEKVRTSNPNSISGIAKRKDYSDKEKEKIVEFMKGLGKDKKSE